MVTKGMIFRPVFCANAECRSARVRDKPRYVFSLELPARTGGMGTCAECGFETVVTVGCRGGLDTESWPPSVRAG